MFILDPPKVVLPVIILYFSRGMLNSGIALSGKDISILTSVARGIVRICGALKKSVITVYNLCFTA